MPAEFQDGETLVEQAQLRRLVGLKLSDMFVSGAGAGSYIFTFENGTEVTITSDGCDLTTTNMTYKERQHG